MSPVKPMALVGRKHPALHRPADTVGHPHEAHRVLAHRMAETLQRHRGLALAAPQVGHSLRIVVFVDAGIHAIVDPVVTADGGLGLTLEGCLSLPGRWYAVDRFPHATVTGMDLAGRPVEFEAAGLQARMWQHESDHLDGVLISDSWPEVRHKDRWLAEHANSA